MHIIHLDNVGAINMVTILKMILSSIIAQNWFLPKPTHIGKFS